MNSALPPVPALLAGPILRRATPNQITFWLALRAPASVCLEFRPAGETWQRHVLQPGESGLRVLCAGEHLCYLLVNLTLSTPLPEATWIDYRLGLKLEDEPGAGWQWGHNRDLAFARREEPGLKVGKRVNALLHGSCRKPHHNSGDGLVAAERHLAALLEADPVTQAGSWPALLMLSGDQIYADDVAGPMLRAIHALMGRLGLVEEALHGLELSPVRDTRSLIEHPDSYYRRVRLLPRNRRTRSLIDLLFGGARKPIFTSDNANNHLITLGEYLAMYLLVWSPVPWRLIEPDPPSGLSRSEADLYQREAAILHRFIADLPAVRRLFAHLPVAMIFDDHDITDDWNLNRAWEETVYAHPFSRRMVGNGLLAYLINQGWGNAPQVFDEALFAQVQTALSRPGDEAADNLRDELLGRECWDYTWDTEPLLQVLDTRTRRWRSESSDQRPSGLLDWEALTDLQHNLRGHDAVILVSAGPIFGVKLIEVIQRLFTLFGYPLVVDAENWMAHPGTANGILNVFRHKRTPRHFIVLSGDVHYSFVYDVELRGRTRGPDIWQICSSGVRNAFPERLLDLLDRLNRILYSPRSPLNWFTRRRRMRIIPRKPEGIAPGRRLLNTSGIGLVELDSEGRPQRIFELLPDGRRVAFRRRERESRWH